MTFAQYYENLDLSDYVVGDMFVLSGKSGAHALVKRPYRGEKIAVTNGSERIIGVVQSIDNDRKEVTLEIFLHQRFEKIREIVLVQALAKNGRDEQAIEMATELGVDTIIPWEAQRSIVRWKGAKEAKVLEKWKNLVEVAALQSRRISIPRIGPKTTSKTLVESLKFLELSSRGYIQKNSIKDQKKDEPAGLILVLHEESDIGWHQLKNSTFLESYEIIIVVVGPEGGISSEEIEIWKTQLYDSYDLKVVKLGENILRASTAGPAMLSVLNGTLSW